MDTIVFQKSQPTFKLDDQGRLLSSEISCHCSYPECDRILLNNKTRSSFLLVRTFFAAAISISSGYRCWKHNRDVGGLDNSMHLIGCALDIRPTKIREGNSIFGEFSNLEAIARLYFDVVILYKDEEGNPLFLHCHNEPE